jgi:hypothetical protein
MRSGRLACCIVLVLLGCGAQREAPRTTAFEDRWLSACGEHGAVGECPDGEPIVDLGAEPCPIAVAAGADGSLGGRSAPSAQERAEAQQVVQAHYSELRRCYEGAMRSRGHHEGTMKLQLVISPDGSVALVRTQESWLDDPALECCINTAVQSWRFPAASTVRSRTLPIRLKEGTRRKHKLR